MARLKLQAALLDVLEQEGLLPFSDDQRSVVSSYKSGTNHWFQGEMVHELRTALVAVAIHKLKAPLDDVARLLILVPNAAIAQSYFELFEQLGRHTDLRVWQATEGGKILKQKEDIYFGADVVIATPSRLNELLNIEGFNSAGLLTLVLDQAQELFKVGSVSFVKRISDSVPQKQRLVFGVDQRIIGNYMEEFAFPYSTALLTDDGAAQN